MRSSALLAGLGVLLAPSLAAAEPWDVRLRGGVALEASVIGESYGLRPELTLALTPEAVGRLRVAVGYLVGPELDFLPVDVGYRAVFRATETVQPLVGIGWESQHFFITDAPAVHRWAAAYLEGGVGVAASGATSLGLAVQLDFAFGPRAGPGLQLRAFATF